MLTHEMKTIIENLNNSFEKYYKLCVLTAMQKDFYKNNFPEFCKVKEFYNEISKQYSENIKMLLFIENHYTDRQKIKLLPQLRETAAQKAKYEFIIWKKSCWEDK